MSDNNLCVHYKSLTGWLTVCACMLLEADFCLEKKKLLEKGRAVMSCLGRGTARGEKLTNVTTNNWHIVCTVVLCWLLHM